MMHGGMGIRAEMIRISITKVKCILRYHYELP